MDEEKAFKENPHPWDEFLKSRTKCILWMKDHMEYDDVKIARQLSMDPTQVYLIRTYAEKERDKENG